MSTPAHNAQNLQSERNVINVAGRWREIVTIKDVAGNILHRVAVPLKLSFHPKDVVQIIIGASILAVPVSLTEEVWQLSAELATRNIVLIGLLSLSFISVFMYYNFYRGHFSQHWNEFFKRTLATYLVSILLVSIVLTLIDKAPWSTDWLLTIKRVVLVAFPASMSAAVANALN